MRDFQCLGKAVGMGFLLKKTGTSCVTGCGACRVVGDPKPASGRLTGWRLAVSAIAVFLLPPGLALGGAALVAGGEAVEFAAALGGLAVGLTVGVAISRLVSQTPKGSA